MPSRPGENLIVQGLESDDLAKTRLKTLANTMLEAKAIIQDVL